MALAVWAYFYLKQSKKPTLKAIELLPQNAFCVFSSDNFNDLSNKLINKSLVLNEVCNINRFNSPRRHIHFFDSLISENESLRQFFKNERILLALYKQENALVYLAGFNLKDLNQERDFTDEFSKMLGGLNKNENGYEFSVFKSGCFMQIKNGAVLLSNSKEKIKEALSADSPKLFNAKTDVFSQQLKENELLSLYVNHSLLNNAGNLSGMNSGQFILSGHSVMDIQVNPDEVSFNGLNYSDSLSILNAFAGQTPQACDFFPALPFNTITFKAYGFDDFSVLENRLKLNTFNSKKFWKDINDSALFNVRHDFYESIQSKIIEAEFKHGLSISKAALVELRDTSKMAELLNYFADSISNFQSFKMAKFALKNENVAELIFGKLLSLKSSYAFICGQYLVLTETRDAAEYYILSFLNSSSVMQNQLFMNYAKENLDLSFNYLYYLSPSKNKNTIKSVFGFLNETDLIYFEKLSDFCLSASNYKSALQFRLNVKYQHNVQGKEVPGLWTFSADTVIYGRPYAFMNHKTGESEVLFQDFKNKLYLLSATGNKIWTKQLDENIISEIYMTDAFRNNKIQMLFNTKNYLYLIDRNGNYVDGFPVKLPAEATNPLTVFDYEKTKDYRLIIACADNKIYNYEISGKRNEGFSPVKTQDRVNVALQYIKVAGSDYLVAVDENGKVYVFSRKGEGRIDLKNHTTQNIKNFFVEASNNINNTRLIYFDDKNSLIETISFSDKKNIIKVNKEFESGTISFNLVDDDKKIDIMVLDKWSFSCFDLSGNVVFPGAESDAELQTLNYYFDADGAYFVVNAISGEIRVISASTGAVTKKIKATGEPLIFDLFKDGKKYLLAADGNNLKCVLLK